MAGLFDDLPDVSKSAPSAPPSARKPTADLFGDIAPAGSWTDNLRDPLAGALKIGPTAVKGVADIARLLTGDTIGGGLSESMQSGMRAIDQVVGSDRLRHQQQQVSNILQSDEFGISDIPGMVADNPRAAVDAAISTIGSMYLPTGAAVGATRALPSIAKVAPIVARVAPATVATGTTIATGAAQNAAETFADTEGEALGDRYKGAAISGAISAALGGLMGGGAEGLIARRLAGESVARGAAAAAKSAATTGAKEFVQEFGEEGGNTLSKQVARGEDIDPQAIGKQGLYGGIIGMGVGGASDVATNVGNIGAGADARMLARELDQAAQEFADTPVTAGEARSLFADLPNAPRSPESVAGDADAQTRFPGNGQQIQTAVAGQQPASGEAARAVGGDQQAAGLSDAGASGVEAAGVGPIYAGLSEIAQAESKKSGSIADARKVMQAYITENADAFADEAIAKAKRDEWGFNRVKNFYENGEDQNAIDYLAKFVDKGSVLGNDAFKQALKAKVTGKAVTPETGNGAPGPVLAQAPVLQNRDRSTPGSVAQMQSIASNPDYGRLGFSRDFANGAPVVAGGQQVPDMQLGRQDVAVASDGRRIPVQYAVVEAADVLPSNQVDGASNADYATATDRMRAIAGNGRIAGLQAAHERGTGKAYVDELLADNLHGINPDVVRGMRQPVLVRIMPTSEVTADIGDVSNTVGNLDLSAVEQARTDSQRVDLDALQFSEDGAITAEAARAFVRGMPQSEHGALLDTNGQPTRQAMDRLNAAVFSRAYGNDGLVRLYAQAQDPEARLVLSALARLAPKMARLEGAGALDFRDVVAQAAELAVNARRSGRRIADAAAQTDIAADPMVGVVLDLFARNPRSNREAIEQLGRAADMAYSEANKADADMFGAVPKASRADVFKQMEPATNEQTSTQAVEQPEGSGPVSNNAQGAPAHPAAPADAGRAEAGRPAESETVAPSARQQSVSGVNESESQAGQAEGAIKFSKREVSTPSVDDDPARWVARTKEKQGGDEVFERDGYTYFAKNSTGLMPWDMDEVYVKSKDGDVVGVASFVRYEGNTARGSIAVDPNHRRKGIGSSIYEAAEKYFGFKMEPEEKHSEYAAAMWAGNHRKFGKERLSQTQRTSTGTGQDALSSYTPEEVTARQDAQAKAQQDQARADREAEQRAQADREVGEFTLTGSDRAADANADQGQMFSKAAPFTDAVDAQTGQPMRVYFSRNKVSSKGNDAAFGDVGRDVEPAGEYMNIDSAAMPSRSGWDSGVVEFSNPLVLEHKDTTSQGWKRDLSEMFGGKTGKALSDAVKRAGYDGIVTRDRYGYSETVNLSGTKSGNQFSEGPATSTGNTTAQVRDALSARFGKTIAAMERRGFLKISERAPEGMAGAQGMYDGKAVHLFADNIQPGDEVGVFLHEAGEHASMEAMLGDRYAGLVARVNELVREGDPDALAAQGRIPADTAPAARDSELLAYMIETVANKKPLTLSAKARRWLADVVAGVRAWWSQTAINRQLDKYGQGIQLTPADIAALAERAVYWKENQVGASAEPSSSATQFAKKKEAAPNPENLIVAHNLTASNVLAAQEIGGLAVPSLAITKADSPIEGFGEITLVGDAGMATPGAKNPVFDADVYSPRFPEVTVKVNEAAVRNVLEPLQRVAEAKGQRMRDSWYAIEDMKRNKLDTAISSLSYDNGARLGYAAAVLGKDLSVPMKSEQVSAPATGLMSDARFAIKVASMDLSTLEPGTDESRSLAKALNSAQMRLVQAMLGDKMNTDEGFSKWVGSVSRRLSMYGNDTTIDGDGVAVLNDLSREGITRIKDLAKNSAAPAQSRETVNLDSLRSMLDREVPREQFDAWLKEQLSPAMGERKIVKSTGRTAAYSMDNIIKEMARKVRDAEGFNYGLGNARSKGATKFKSLAHIQSRRDQVSAKADFEKARQELDTEFSALVDAVEPFKTYERDSATELLAEAIGNSYAKPLSRALADAALDGVPAELQGSIATFAEKLRTAPTEYFEAKPQRAVTFDEFAGAVVPKGLDPAARRVLEDAGLTMVEYDKGDQAARAAAVDQLSRDLHSERGNVRFSKNARSTTGGNVNSLASAAAPWTVPEPGTGDAFIRAIQNNKIDLKRLRDTLAEQYGPLPSRADAYLSEELYHGKIGARVDQLRTDYLEPLLGKIAVAGKNAGVTVDDVNLYLHARHAPERNAAMQKINPGMANNDALSGMSDAQAAATMARFAADGKDAALKAIAADVDQLLTDTRTNLVADGLEDAGMVQAWEAAYKHYVPLQREAESQGSGASKGMGFSVKGPEAKRAVGSNREVVNILANIVAQAETAAIRAEKAEVGRTLLEMARTYPNPEFWKVDVVPTKPRINKDTGLVERNAIDPLYKSADNVVVVKDYGQEHFIVFNKKSDRALAVAHAMKNLDSAPMNKLLTTVGHGTRFLASMLTARNPVFWLTNFARDIQGAMLNLEGTDAEGLQREVLGNLGSAFKGMHALVRGDGRGQWARYAQDMKDAGGTTGYMQIFENSDKRMGDIRKEVARMQQGKADPRRLARQLLDFVDDYNDIIENAVRLSVFQAARDSGVSTERAASLAKNITVNFNRKGNLTPVVNSLYMFFNASVQGTARLAQLLASSRKAQVAVGGIAMIGFLLDALNRAMSDDDEETGRNRYDLIPEFEKSKNWIIMNPMRPGEYVKIPLPLGPHVFHNAGRLLSDAMFRDDPRNAAEYSWAFVNTMMDAFSPLGETASMGQLIAPSIADPVLQLAENKSFTGAPVYKSSERGFGPPDPKPAYTRHFDSTPSIWKQASRMLNDITGGDKQKPGLVNIEPDILKHIAWTLTGGPGRTVDQAVDSAQAGARGVEMTPNRLPLVSRFYGENDDRQRERIYYDDKKRVEQAKATFDYFNKNGRRDLAREVAEELGNGDYSAGLKMMRGHKGTNAALKKINSQIKREMERADSGEDRAEQLKALRKRRTEMMSRTINRDDGEE